MIRLVWRPLRAAARRRPRLFTVAGPIALLAVVVSWAGLLILGWALVYWPQMPDGFTFMEGTTRGHELVESLYVSLVTLGTLGYGDIVPAAAGLRLLAPVEALIGFGLLSASISWLLSIYPILSRRRSLAYEVNLLVNTRERVGVSVLDLDPDAAEQVLGELVSRLVAAERDLATFPVAFYFAEIDDRFALPEALPALLDLAERAMDESQPEAVRVRASMLVQAVDDFTATAVRLIGSDPGATTRDRIAAYRREHLR